MIIAPLRKEISAAPGPGILIQIKGTPVTLLKNVVIARGLAKSPALPFGATYDFHQFRNLAPLLGSIARSNCSLNAMVNMITQNFFLRTSERCPNCRNLCDNVDAIAVFFDHAGEPTDLALDPFQSLDHRCLGSSLHTSYIPLQGIGFKLGTSGKISSEAPIREI